MLLEAVTDAAQDPWVLRWWPVITFVSVALFWAVVKILRREIKQIKREIVDEVKSSTTQIQPSSNGGKSLADANGKLDKLLGLPALVVAVQASVTDIQARVGSLEDSQSQHLRDHARASFD